jgi:DNA replication ATP-dependent helicase Dna2
MENRPLPPNDAIAPLLYRELHKLLRRTDLSWEQRAEAVYQLLQRIFQIATQGEKLPFSTHFARMAYTGHKFGLAKALQYHIHQFRRRLRQQPRQTAITQADLDLGFKAAADLILGIWSIPPYEELARELPLDWPQPMQEVPIAQFRPYVRVLALEDDPVAEQLLVRDEAHPAQTVYVQYNLTARNEAFTPTIQLLRQVTGFPISLNLLDVEIDTEGIYRPQAFVLEPDYLIDVSAVADTFQGRQTHPWGFLLKKFLPFDTSPALVLGNIANYFLDQLMTDPDITFQELVQALFGLNPLAFCTFSDGQVREMMGKAQGHFVRLKQMVRQGFEQEGIRPAACYLEPTFFSEQYGLQGRLDLLHHDPAPDGKHAIVELKSGRPFMPNIHGISPNHYIQTVLYDLLIRSAFGRQSNVGCYILYSGQTERILRFAPTVKAQQYEALQLRNQLVAIEYLLAQLGTDHPDLLAAADRLFGRLNPDRFPQLKGFSRRDLSRFHTTYHQLSTLERSYFGAFAGFVAREHLLAKTGVQGEEQLNGLAGLWLDHPMDKEQNYQRLAELELAVNQSQEKVPLLILLRGPQTNPLANFRVGDICVLFPSTVDGRGMLCHQVFKCTITALNAEQVTVRLRSQQFNPRIFQEQHQWNIEHDVLDGSFLAYYRGLFAWAEAPAEQRQLLLSQRPPHRPAVPLAYPWPAELTDEQSSILDAIISAEEYFLLWGPPGTGKTSKMLHHLVQYFLTETKENLLLLAYTNRAVDEICEAIEAIGPAIKSQYLRIGSNYGTHPQYQDQLLQNAIEAVQTRRELRQLITERRIFVGTVASVSGKEELFALKSFDRVIIDEASQLLEPLLIGLLPRFKNGSSSETTVNYQLWSPNPSH